MNRLRRKSDALRLLTMICLSIARRARVLTLSPSKYEIVLAVLLP